MVVAGKSKTATGFQVVVMAGGTGGHIFPALAVAERLRDLGYSVAWLGSADGLEAKIAKQHHFTMLPVTSLGLRGKGLGQRITGIWQAVRSLFCSYCYLRRHKVQLVIGFGGFVAGPGGVAAWLARSVLLIHEQNSKAGLTNRLLLPLCRYALLGFTSSLPGKKTRFTGNPLRAQVAQKTKYLEAHKPLRLLVLGGSQGAKILNDTVPAALALLDRQQRPTVWHQAGAKTLAQTEANYRQQQVSAQVTAFIDDMQSAYSWADIIIARAGALTVSEIAYFGRAAIFVPLPQASDDHQYYNAIHMVQANAAICYRQSTLTAQLLAEKLQDLNANPKHLVTMAHAATTMATEDATSKVVDIIVDQIGPPVFAPRHLFA